MNEKLASLANGGSLGIIYSDVMGLKQINDDFGHQAGDEALIYACENLKAHFRINVFTVLAVMNFWY